MVYLQGKYTGIPWRTYDTTVSSLPPQPSIHFSIKLTKYSLLINVLLTFHVFHLLVFFIIRYHLEPFCFRIFKKRSQTNYFKSQPIIKSFNIEENEMVSKWFGWRLVIWISMTVIQTLQLFNLVKLLAWDKPMERLFSPLLFWSKWLTSHVN